MRFTLFLAATALMSCGMSGGKIYQGNGSNVVQTSGDRPSIINGGELPVDKWREIVNVNIGTKGCSGTVVGPKTIALAAHCGVQDAVVTTTINGKSFTGKITRSGLYPAKDHDLGLVLLDQEVLKADVGQFASISGTAEIGKQLFIAGYGCTAAGGGAIDGKLRGGFTTATAFVDYDVQSQIVGGAALCYGDSGGPTFLSDDSTAPKLVGINSKGDLQNQNFSLRTDLPDSQAFFARIIKESGVIICGINGTDALCGKTDPTPVLPGSFSITGPISNAPSMPIASWTYSSNAITYNVLISTKQDCASPLQTYSVTGNTQQMTTLADGSFYLCVTASNAVGMTTATNNGFPFTVKTDVPPVPNGQYPAGFVYDTAKSLSTVLCNRARGMRNTVSAAYSDFTTLVSSIEDSTDHACDVLESLNAKAEFDASYRSLRVLKNSDWPVFSGEVDRLGSALDLSLKTSRDTETNTLNDLMKVYEPNGQPVLSRCTAQLLTAANPTFIYEGVSYIGFIGFGTTTSVAARQALTCGLQGECQVAQCWTVK